MSNFLKRNKIEYVFVDWFGVLSTNYYWCIQSKKDKDLKDWCNKVFHNDQTLSDWMRGKHSLEHLATLGSLTSEDILNLFLKDLEFYRPDLDLLETISRLFPQAKKVLVSDNMKLFDHILMNYDILNTCFDRKYFSYEVGRLKSDQPHSLFTHILEDLGIPDFQNCLLIDDSPTNCNNFKKLRGKTILID